MTPRCWMDLSAALVHELAPPAAAFVLVAVVRTGERSPDPISALWRNNMLERVELQDLVHPDVGQVLVEHLGGPVDGLTIRRLFEASAGSALMVRDLVAAGLQAGALRHTQGFWRTPQRAARAWSLG